MMKAHEQSRGRSFAYVVKIRPDLHFNRPIKCPVEVDGAIPTVCRDGGGGGGDAVIVMGRWAAPALEGMWRTDYNCKMQ